MNESNAPLVALLEWLGFQEKDYELRAAHDDEWYTANEISEAYRQAIQKTKELFNVGMYVEDAYSEAVDRGYAEAEAEYYRETEQDTVAE